MHPNLKEKIHGKIRDEDCDRGAAGHQNFGRGEGGSSSLLVKGLMRALALEVFLEDQLISSWLES